MAELPRLNGVIGALEKGQHALTTFSQADVESAIALATAKYDGVFYEMEHNAYDIRAFRDCLQFMLNRGQIAKSGSVAPAVTPHVRIPPNGGEKAQFHAKQVLDLGAYGIIYPRLKNKPLYEPAGIRGDGPTQAVRYWGVTQQEYYERADVWPLNPKGEIFVILMIEDTEGIKNLKDILKEVPGIGAILIGEGDLSQELGYPRQYEHKVVLEAMAQIVNTCKEAGVVVGHPHVEAGNAERIVKEGYRFLMCAPVRSYGHLDAARKFAGRA
jgi:4-hydroxy-2-oxoheptanedioate aldolase